MLTLELLLLLCHMAVAYDAGSPKREIYDSQAVKNATISNDDFENIFRSCPHSANERRELEEKLTRKGRVGKGRKTDPSLTRRRRSDTILDSFEHLLLPFAKATEKLFQQPDLSDHDINVDLPQRDYNGEFSKQAKGSCESALSNPQCDSSSVYRTIDGSCNNLRNPTWGMANVCNLRLLSASYVGESGFRQSVRGGSLPHPRTISVNVHSNLNRPTDYVTHMYIFFGQLLDHDITFNPASTTNNNRPIQCCQADQKSYPQCSPIIISPDDYFYSQYNVTCLNFVRSVVCPTCRHGHRVPMNQVTSFIDASFVYGNSLNEMSGLRANDGTGKMRVLSTAVGDLLPQSNDPGNDQCSFPSTNDICFEAGDSRANQHTTLTSLHTLFLREHNRIASELRRINPHWSGERLFQESRKIVGALMQVITYKEYLPITMGADFMSRFRLWMTTEGSTTYDMRTNPTIYIEFTTAAFRFGHSMINSIVTNSPLNSTNGRRLLRNEFFQPFELYNGIMGSLLRGTTNCPAQWFDRHVSPDVTNYLYRRRGNQTGLDLPAIDIYRGRDQGIPPYVNLARYASYGAVQIRRFSDLVRYNLMPRENEQLLRQNYRDVHDIDLLTGILNEIPKGRAIVGPTAAFIIGMQFRNLKFGDRFYFEHRNQRGSFTYQQIKELKKVTLSKIICANTDVKSIASNAFIFSSRSNPPIDCTRVQGSGFDLSYWKS